MKMFILPRTNKDFLKTEYWDSFFKKRGKEAFEWYGEYQELCGILHRYIKPSDKILVIGCGNSTVSSNLYDLGYKDITNIDVSGVVIKRMQQKYGRVRPGLNYLQMDALQTDFSAGSFSTIFDKGTLDALFPDDSEESKSRITRLLNEVDRLLKFGGRYVCVSLLQEHILSFILDYFLDKCWLIRVCRCIEVEKNKADGSCMPVFAVICTKIRKLQNIQSVIEISMDDSTVTRTTKDDLIKTINSIQQVEIVCSGLNRNCLSGVEKEAVIEVARPCDSGTRYTITVIDPETPVDADKMKFAAFVIPFGKEKEWMFSSSEGRQILRKNCRVDRVAMIAMHDGHEYPDFKGIQNELTDTIIKLAPVGVTERGEKVTFLTMSVSNNENESNIIAKGESKFSGKYVVKEVIENDEYYRRLIFLNRGTVIQSEVRLKKNSNDGTEEVDLNYISCDYHILLSIGVSLGVSESEKSSLEALVIGLGGGVVSTLLHRCFPKVYITAVEIDKEVVDIAEKYFCLKTDDRMKINISDGLKYLADARKKGIKYDVIIFDVDNKDLQVGITCPPVEFLQMNVLNEVVRCLTDKGLFLLNLVCRSKELKNEVFNKLRSIFAGVVSIRTKEDVNEVVICWKKSLDINEKNIEKAAKKFYSCSKAQNLILDDDILNVGKLMETIKVGAEVYVHIPKEKRRKWDTKTRKGIFVGYNENIKGYKVWFGGKEMKVT